MALPPDLPNAPDQDVVAWALLGDEAGYRELERRYQPRIQTVISRIVRDPDLTKELANVALHRAFRALDTYRPEYPFGPWMRTIARNTARDHLRAKRQREALERQAALEVSTPERLAGTAIPASDPKHSPWAKLDKEAFIRALEKAIQRLGGYDRQCFILHIVEELPCREVAKRLGMSPAAVRAHVSRARKQLRAMLGLPSNYLTQDTPTPEPRDWPLEDTPRPQPT